MRVFPILLPVLLIISPLSASALKVEANVDQTSISPQDVVGLSVTIAGGEGSVDVAPIRDFKVISQGTSTSVQIINSRVSRQVVHNFTLIPLKNGKLTVPALPVSSGGKTYMTDPISILVQTGQQQGNTLPDVFVRSEVSRKDPYEGQQIIYTFRIFSAAPLANVRFQPPSFEGFSARRIEQQKSYKKMVSGRQYQINDVLFVLTPLTAEDIEIEPALLSCDILIGGGRRQWSPFGSIFSDPFFDRSERQRKIFKSEGIFITVKELPPYSRPGKFSGLVGNFEISSTLESKILKVGESTTLSVVVSGAGNIMDARMPEFAAPEELKAYEDAPEESISVGSKGYSGKKMFRTAIVASNAGTYKLGPISLNYFNPDKGVYETAATAALDLSVEPSDSSEELRAAVANENMNETTSKQKVEFTGRDILPIKDGIDVLQSTEHLSLKKFSAYLLAPIILYLLMLTAFQLAHRKNEPASEMVRRAEKSLKEAKNLNLHEEHKLMLLHRAMVSAILAKAGVKGESLTYAEAEEILSKSRVDSETSKEVKKLLMKIDSARFGGGLKEGVTVDRLLKEVSKNTNILIRS